MFLQISQCLSHTQSLTLGCTAHTKRVQHIIIIINVEICKAPTLRFKGLNKHSITHKMYIEMEKCHQQKKKEKKKS